MQIARRFKIENTSTSANFQDLCRNFLSALQNFQSSRNETILVEFNSYVSKWGIQPIFEPLGDVIRINPQFILSITKEKKDKWKKSFLCSIFSGNYFWIYAGSNSLGLQQPVYLSNNFRIIEVRENWDNFCLLQELKNEERREISENKTQEEVDQFLNILTSIPETVIETFCYFLGFPYGFSILAGPKGSGKSTFTRYLVKRALTERDIDFLIASSEENYQDIAEHLNLLGISFEPVNIVDREKFLRLSQEGCFNIETLSKLFRQATGEFKPLLLVADPFVDLEDFNFLLARKSFDYTFVRKQVASLIMKLSQLQIILLGVLHTKKDFNLHDISSPEEILSGFYGSGALSAFAHGVAGLRRKSDLGILELYFQAKGNIWQIGRFEPVKLSGNFVSFAEKEVSSQFDEDIINEFLKDPVKMVCLEIFVQNENKPLTPSEVFKLLQQRGINAKLDTVKKKIASTNPKRLSLLREGFIAKVGTGNYQITLEGKHFFNILMSHCPYTHQNLENQNFATVPLGVPPLSLAVSSGTSGQAGTPNGDT